jgi:small subunit ribosomal protein S2
LARQWARRGGVLFRPFSSGPDQTQDLIVGEQMATFRRILKNRSMEDVADKVDMSRELESKLNTEFVEFLKEFVFDHDFTDEFLAMVDIDDTKSADVHSILSVKSKTAEGNVRGRIEFPNVQPTEAGEPYSTQELYLRRLFHAGNTAGIGSVVKDVYRPHKDIFDPPNIRETSIASLLASGAHLGHSTALLRQNNQPFVYGIRDGIHIIDLDVTLTYLRRAAKIAEGIAERGGIVLFVGTMEGQERSLQVAANRAHGCYVHTRWIPGTLTNPTQISGAWDRLEVDMADSPTGRKLAPNLTKTIVKPDLVVILNPVENRNLINECIATRVPTIGIIDTNSEPSLVTYPIPANDDSLRATDLIVGVISKASQRGRQRRIKNFIQHKNEADAAQGVGAFHSVPQETGIAEEDIAAQAIRDQKVERRTSAKAA